MSKTSKSFVSIPFAVGEIDVAELLEKQILVLSAIVEALIGCQEEGLRIAPNVV